MFLFKLNPVGLYLLLVLQVLYVYCQCLYHFYVNTNEEVYIVIQNPSYLYQFANRSNGFDSLLAFIIESSFSLSSN